MKQIVCLHLAFKECNCTFDEKNKICPNYYPITLWTMEVKDELSLPVSSDDFQERKF